MDPRRMDPDAPSDAQVAQLALARGLITGEQLRGLSARRHAGDGRPLRELLTTELGVAPEAVARLLRGATLDLTAPPRAGPAQAGPACAGPAPAADLDPGARTGTLWPGGGGPLPRVTPPSGWGRFRDPGSGSGSGVGALADDRAGSRAGSGAGPAPLDASSRRLRGRLEGGETVVLGPGLEVRAVRLLGQGGMGTVHLVHDPAAGRPAALKLIRDEGDTATRARRFRREALVTARLDHPGVPPVYHVGRTPAGDDFILMRFVDGEALDAILDRLFLREPGRTQGHGGGRSVERRAPEPRDLLHALVKTAETLAYAHSRGVVHRDLKPANVMIGAFGEVLVMDWGLAQDPAEADPAPGAGPAGADPGGSRGLTQDGAVLGTPGYMPPEQARSGEVDGRADVFALGALLVEVLTGEPPFTGATVLEVLARTAAGHPTLPRQRDPAVAPELDAIARKALQADPADRYESADALAADLSAYLEGRPVSVHRYGLLEQTWRLARRNPGPFATLVAAFLLVLAGVGLVGRASAAAVAAERRRTVEAARAAALAATLAAPGGAAPHAADRGEGAAPAVAEAPDGRGRGDDARIGAALAALQAAQRWRVLAPEDPDAARAQFAAAAALAREAQAATQWSLALEAWRQADGLGVDDARARAGLAETEAARDAEAQRRRDEVTALLEAAARGELTRRPQGLEDGVFRIVRLAEDDTIAALVARLEALAAELERVEEALLARTVEPSPEEAASGEGPLVGLAEALAARRAAWPAGALARAHADLLEAAHARLLRRARRERRTPPRAALDVLGEGQGAALGAGRLDLLRLLCEVLGRVDRRPPVVAALGRYLATEGDALRASAAAFALCRLGGEDAVAQVLAARLRFGRLSLFGRLIEHGLALVEAPEPRLAAETAEGHFSRGEARALRGDRAGALADFTRAVALDPGLAEAWSRRGNLLHERGDSAAALADYERALALRPSEPRYWGNKGNALHRLGRLDDAVAAYDRAYALDPELHELIANRASVLHDQGHLDRALEDLGRVLARDPQVVPAWVARAYIRLDLGDLEGALADLDRAIEVDPRWVGVWVQRARVRKKAGDLAGALADLDHAVLLVPDDLAALIDLGELRAEGGDLEGALRELDRAVELAPTAPQPRVARARARAQAGDHDGALADYEVAVREAPPGQVRPLLDRAELLVARRRLPEALADYGAAIERAPDDARGWIGRARVRATQGDLAGARADLDAAVARAPGPAALQARASFRRGRGDLAGALGDLDAAVARAPRDVELLVARARMRGVGGDRAGAQADLAEVLRIAPRHPAAYALRSTMRLSEGDVRGAREDVERALEADPRSADAWAQRALLHLLAGDADRGRLDLERAEALGTPRARVHELRGMVFETQGQLAPARQELEQGVALDPAVPSAWGALARLRLRTDDRAGAIEAAERALALAPGYPLPVLVRGLARAAQGDAARARADLERYLELAPGSSEAKLARDALGRLGR